MALESVLGFLSCYCAGLTRQEKELCIFLYFLRMVVSAAVVAA